MSADVIRAQYDALARIAQQFQGQAEAVQQLKQGLQATVDPLANGGWQGQGAAAFFAEMESDLFPVVDRLQYALQTAVSTTQEVITIMQEAEEEAARPFRGQYQGGTSYGFTNTPTTKTSNSKIHSQPILDVPPRDYLVMSVAAYGDEPDLPDELRQKEWQKLDISVESDEGYQANAYYNPKTGEVVIAHRGTDNWEDTDDDAAIYFESVPDQFEDSRKFTQDVKDELARRGITDYEMVHTGHSLGAVLADLNAAQDGTRAYTFENPGTAEILQTQGVKYDPQKHVAYQGNPNPINQTNSQAGNIVQVIPRHKSDPKLEADWGNKGAAIGQAGGRLAGPAGGLAGNMAGQQGGKLAADIYNDHSATNLLDAMDAKTGFPQHNLPPTMQKQENPQEYDWEDVAKGRVP
jgi:WXG100 family type VII secretion target